MRHTLIIRSVVIRGSTYFAREKMGVKPFCGNFRSTADSLSVPCSPRRLVLGSFEIVDHGVGSTFASLAILPAQVGVGVASKEKDRD